MNVYKVILVGYKIVVMMLGEVLFFYISVYELVFGKFSIFCLYKSDVKDLDLGILDMWFVKVDFMGDEVLFFDLGIIVFVDYIFGIELSFIYFICNDCCFSYMKCLIMCIDVCVYKFVMKIIKCVFGFFFNFSFKVVMWFFFFWLVFCVVIFIYVFNFVMKMLIVFLWCFFLMYNFLMLLSVLILSILSFMF